MRSLIDIGMNANERRAKILEQPNPISRARARARAEAKIIAIADRKRQRLERKLYIVALADKRRRIDKATLQKIGDEVGLTRERIRQLLNLISPKP